MPRKSLLPRSRHIRCEVEMLSDAHASDVTQPIPSHAFVAHRTQVALDLTVGTDDDRMPARAVFPAPAPS